MLRIFFICCLLLMLVACTTTVSREAEKFDRSKSSKGDLYVQLGIQYLEKGQLDVALNNLEKALKIDPRNSEAHNVIALIYEHLGEAGFAMNHYQEAVNLRDSNASAHNNFARLLCSRGEFRQAEAHFKKAYKTPLYKRPWIALTNAGRCAREEGDLQLADQYLRQALEEKAEYPPALLELAQVNFTAENFFKVRAFLQRYQSVSEHTSQSLWIGIRGEHALGDDKSVKKYIDLLHEKYPNSDEAGMARSDFPQY